jgi:hypothetical protein
MPFLSDVVGTAAISPLVLSQRHVSRHGISEGQHVTIVDKERKRPGDAGSHHGVAGALGKGGVGRGVDEGARYRGQDVDRGTFV